MKQWQMALICANIYIAASITRWEYLFGLGLLWTILSLAAYYMEKP